MVLATRLIALVDGFKDRPVIVFVLVIVCTKFQVLSGSVGLLAFIFLSLFLSLIV